MIAYDCVRAIRHGLAAISVLSLASLSGLSGCKTVDLDGGGSDTADTSAEQGTAILRITNRIEVDPGTLTFYLFPGSSSDYANAANARDVGSVGFESTKAFTVPAGTWKLAYADRAGVLAPMRDIYTDEWVKSILEKDGDYSVILKSDGEDVLWVPTFETDPPLQ